MKTNNGTPSITDAKLLTKEEYQTLNKAVFTCQPYGKGKQALISNKNGNYVVATYICGNWMSQLKEITKKQIKSISKPKTQPYLT